MRLTWITSWSGGSFEPSLTRERSYIVTIEERIEKLENSLFYLDMKDRWTPADHISYDKMVRELESLRKENK